MRSPRVARASLTVLFAVAVAIGLVAALVPRTFYDDFPFFASWVELLPPFNEHLVTDVGGLYLGFAVLFAWAAATLDRVLIRALCTAWLLTAAIHLAFHAGHLEGFSTADAIAELISLALLLAPPLVTLWAVGEVAGAEPAA
ncbi:MAG: hypothetical protein R2725_05630 [Solirubrobacterales bacterium]